MAEVQARIVAHMNKDHRIALEDYLSVYGNIAIDDKIANITMKDIELDNITLSFNHFDIEFPIIKPIPIDPPMKDIREARIKLTEMAKYCASKRGFSHFQVAETGYPASWGDFTILGALLILLMGFFSPSTLFNVILPALHCPPALVSFLDASTKSILICTILIHLIEIQFVLNPLLKKYRVPFDYKLEWWLLTFIDGYFTIRRFKNIVAKYEEH
ncbi:BA75_01118T0 [Komagataella pastoris]|uniref:BA75_01118T0 n=1 Tax=Komagataella pastoris TaxID=4922 RepID=A0A1B2J740_PICPA|nr:BA75_01118T0 [Komagataella pastoris]